MIAPLVIAAGSATHTGLRRSLNEDSILASTPVFIVADGMGGHEAGERASAAVVEEFSRCLGRSSLVLDDVREALSRSRRAVDDLSISAAGRAGTTLSGLVLAAVDGMGYWLVFNIGDSRTYRLSDDELEQITVDHSVVQELIETGELTADEAVGDPRRNIITRAIGAGSTGDADFWMFPAERGDRMLVCSDGLSSEVSAERIREILAREADPQIAAGVLLGEAMDAGGRDNISVIVVDAVSVAARPGVQMQSDEHVDDDTRPRAAAAGGMR